MLLTCRFHVCVLHEARFTMFIETLIDDSPSFNSKSEKEYLHLERFFADNDQEIFPINQNSKESYFPKSFGDDVERFIVG